MIAAVVAAFVVGWLQTGKRGLIFAALATSLLIPAAWWLADWWVTDRERIEEIIHEVARSVEANDHAGVVAFIDESQTRQQALAELPKYRFTMAQVNRLREIRLLPGNRPPSASAELSVKVDVGQQSGPIQNVRVLRLIRLSLEKTGTGPDGEPDWMITGYSHAPMTGQPDQYSTNTLR